MPSTSLCKTPMSDPKKTNQAFLGILGEVCVAKNCVSRTVSMRLKVPIWKPTLVPKIKIWKERIYLPTSIFLGSSRVFHVKKSGHRQQGSPCLCDAGVSGTTSSTEVSTSFEASKQPLVPWKETMESAWHPEINGNFRILKWRYCTI